jgi:hypothetical protein
VAPSDKSDKDEFNFDDFQYSGVKLTPVPDFTEEVPAEAVPTEDPLAAPSADAAVESPLAPSEEVLPLEPEDKKGKKKAKKEKVKKEKIKKEKPVKAKKTPAVVPTAEGEKKQSAFIAELTKASPYTVMLGMTVVALFLAVIFLLIEWSRYDLNTHPPKSIQLSSTMNRPVAESFADYRA